ncbi:NAD(P)H-hydrate dehydratase [Profundibacter sp.]|uniref:NAD(P)H-hydrate dehydratase n=1 Tax=Profundibacter sp. TaxID=3101071 RepID=UPI003D0DB950
MTELLTAAQMRAIERAAIESGEVTGLELMERAGRGVVEAVFEEWPELAKAPHRAVVLCGPGNNGGDGFVVARLLKEWGWEVEVFLYGDAEKLPPDARVNYIRWCEFGEVARLELDTFPRLEIVHTDLFCDALFGTGLARPVEGEVAKVLKKIRLAIWPYERSLRQEERLVAIDVPTSLGSDSGKVLEGPNGGLAHFRADLTVTFHSAKVGHFLEDGPELTGKLVIKPIGLKSIGRRKQAVRLLEHKYPDSFIKEPYHHKYTHGHSLILSGASGKGGAARLAARGALRIGAGVVSVGCPPDAVAENAAQLNAIMLSAVHDGDALARVLQDERINALCLGPGLGLKRAAELVPVALGSGGVKPRPTVLDADALTAMAKDPALFDMLHRKCVLTPHAGEFARLFPDIAEKLNTPATKGPAYSKVDATREAAKRAGCVVLFKGADTVIADRDGRASINSAHYERAAPWLATAGSGDVLAGFIAGLLARRFNPMQAAETAAWLHVECALQFGPGLIAEDLPEQLPEVFRKLDV